MRSHFSPHRRAAALGLMRRADRPACRISFKKTELPGCHWNRGEHDLTEAESNRTQRARSQRRCGCSRLSAPPAPRAKPRPRRPAPPTRTWDWVEDCVCQIGASLPAQVPNCPKTPPSQTPLLQPASPLVARLSVISTLKLDWPKLERGGPIQPALLTVREVKAKQEPAGVKLRVGHSEPCGRRALPGAGPSAGAHVCGTGRGEGLGLPRRAAPGPAVGQPAPLAPELPRCSRPARLDLPAEQLRGAFIGLLPFSPLGFCPCFFSTPRPNSVTPWPDTLPSLCFECSKFRFCCPASVHMLPSPFSAELSLPAPAPTVQPPLILSCQIAALFLTRLPSFLHVSFLAPSHKLQLLLSSGLLNYKAPQALLLKAESFFTCLLCLLFSLALCLKNSKLISTEANT